MLLNYFSRHGEIEEGSVAYDKDSNESRGFGFVTYRTSEAAKKAIDDPKKALGGRNIIAKYADSHKGKAGQPSFTAAVVPMAALPMTPGYVQPGQPPIGYIYPQTVVPYPAAPYPSAPTTPSPYTTQGQAPYPSVAAKKDQYGFPPQAVGMNSYPYYYPK